MVNKKKSNKNPYLTMEPPVPGAFYKRIYKKIKCLYETTQGVEISFFFYYFISFSTL